MTFELKHYSPEAPVTVRGALFSDCRLYRYDLIRAWSSPPSGPWVAFVGLNPSTADELEDDPTIRRCIGFARSWGFTGMHMLNLFAYRSTDPDGLLKVEDPVGPDTDRHLLKVAREVDQVVLCWGNHGRINDRCDQVLQLFPVFGMTAKVFNLGTTREGHPRHPLYLKKTTERVRQWDR